MATTTLQKVSVYFQLANGTNADGSTKLETVTLPALDKDTYTDDKVAPILTAIQDVLNLSIVGYYKYERSSLTM